MCFNLVAGISLNSRMFYWIKQREIVAFLFFILNSNSEFYFILSYCRIASYGALAVLDLSEW